MMDRLVVMHRTMMTVMDRTMPVTHRMMHLSLGKCGHKYKDRSDQQ
jgi:hypothetical protein